MSHDAVHGCGKTMRLLRAAAVSAVVSASLAGCAPEGEERLAPGPGAVAEKFAEAVLASRFDVAGECVAGARMSGMLEKAGGDNGGSREPTVFRPAGVRIEGDEAVVQLEFTEKRGAGGLIWYGVYFLKDSGNGWKITDLSGGREPMALESVAGCREEALRRIRRSIEKSVGPPQAR